MTSKTKTEPEIEQLSPTLFRIQVTVPSEKYMRKIDSAYRELANGANIPGFRPGKAPRNIINRYYDKEKIRASVTEDVIEETLWPAIKEKELTVVGRPRIEPAEWKEGQDFSYEARLEIVPSIDEINYEDIVVKLPEREITDEILDDEIRGISLRFGESTQITDRPAKPGDIVTLQFSGEVPEVMVETLEGEVPWNYDEQELQIELGRAKSLKGLEDALEGMELEEIKDFDLVLPDDFPDIRVRGKTMKGKARIKSIQEIKPAEIIDEFVKDKFSEQGIEDVKTLRERVRGEIENSHQSLDERATREQVHDYLASRLDFPLPEGMVKSEFANSLDRILKTLADADKNIEELMKPDNEQGLNLRKRTRYDSERTSRANLLIRDIARRESIGVSTEEVTNYISMFAYRQQLREQDLKVMLKDPQFIEDTRFDILQRKVMHFLAGKVTKTRVPPDEYSEFIEKTRLENEESFKAMIEDMEDPLEGLKADHMDVGKDRDESDDKTRENEPAQADEQEDDESKNEPV